LPEIAMSFAPENDSLAKPETLLRVPVGLASPLWGLFAGAAVTGAAWWWMTRWAKPENLEAMFGAAAEAETAATTEALALAQPATDAVEAAAQPLEIIADEVQAATEPAVEAAIEADAKAEEFMAETVAEALIVAEPAVEAPVGGESAPISPLLEAVAPVAEETDLGGETAAMPKLKKKAAAPKAD
jgi:hypothetical protein